MITVNSLAAVCFLMGCYGKLFFSAKWWPVGLLTIAAFYFFVLLLLFLLFWIFIKPGWSLISVISIAIAYVPFSHIIPPRLTSDFSIIKNTADTRVMSWNVAQFDVLYNKRSPETRDKMLELIGPTLVGTGITENEKFIRELTDATHIDRLNIGPIPTIKLDWLQPHEGNIVDFLFRARAYQVTPDRLATLKR